MQSVVMKAEGDEEMVLCTDDHTYSVKLADTSNAMFLVPPSSEVGSLFSS